MASDVGIKLTDIAPRTLTAEFGVDPIRYYLLRETPFGNDGEFSFEGIIARYNTDLANNLGNLVARVATVVGSKCDGRGRAPTIDAELRAVANEVVQQVGAAWEEFAPHRALEAAWQLIGAANADLEKHAPWKMESGPEVDAVMGNALEVLRLTAILISPAMPETAEKIWHRIGLQGSPADVSFRGEASWGRYPEGLLVEKGEPLFPRIKSDA